MEWLWGAALQIDWLETRAGKALLTAERRRARSVLERVFGDQILQIGHWGPPGFLLKPARTQYSLTVGAETSPPVDALMTPERLAIATDSVDAVMLPHTLELSREPHAVLRESVRILRPDGKLLLFGFNPVSWWGVRHQLSLAGYPAGILRHISGRRIADWLNLLSMRPERIKPCYVWPVRNRYTRLLQRTGLGAGAYLIVATKVSVPMTVIRPALRRTPALVTGLVNPTTRSVA